ncbi:MAG TPA: response regulator [Burkholderiaceae bacterium]|nr:response regulator [Burkholderiaceae bacterium]
MSRTTSSGPDASSDDGVPVICVVDDSIDDRELVIRAVRKDLPDAVFAAPVDERSFRMVLASRAPDVVVTDYRIGWIDGLTVLARVKARWPDVPVVMFTNTGSEEICAEGMKSGLSDYVIKRRDQYPKVSHAVRTALDQSRTRRLLALQTRDLERSRSELALLLERERRARAEAELARAEALRATHLKDEFLANLSHELRTPLNAVLGWAQLLRMKLDDPKALQEGLEVIIRNTRLQAQLVADLLDMSGILSGQMRLDVGDVDLVPVVESAIQTVRPSADDKRIVLRTLLDPAAGPVRGDPARIQQIVWNLLVNAVKFTPPAGHIEIRLERVASRARLEVTDSGEGIAPDFLPLVFEAFRQGDGSARRRHRGLGLGLSIVKSLTEMHGGRVEARSPGVGRGSTFLVSLPIAAVQPETGDAGAESVSKLSTTTLTGLSVLVVDDDPDTSALIARTLEQYGARTTCRHSAGDGLEALRRLRPDVLVSDIGMPGEDGYAFIGRVRDLPSAEGGNTPSAALSAFARSEDRQRALFAGFDSYAIKPVEPAELVAVVANLAARARRG